MRRPSAFLLFAAVAAASVFITTHPAHAQQRCGTNKLCIGDKSTEIHMKGLTYFEGPDSANDGGNGVVFSGRGTLIYDFASLTSTSAALNTVCAESSAGTATGCRFGDQVLLGIDQAPVNAFGTISAYVSAADQFKVRACAVGVTDGGTFDMPDASYTVRCVR